MTTPYDHPIRRVSRSQGRTLTWLARELGISYGYLMQILRDPDALGSVPPPVWFYSRVAHLLGVAESDIHPPEGATTHGSRTG